MLYVKPAEVEKAKRDAVEAGEFSKEEADKRGDEFWLGRCKKRIPLKEELEEQLERWREWAEKQTCPEKGSLWRDETTAVHERQLVRVRKNLYSGNEDSLPWPNPCILSMYRQTALRVQPVFLMPRCSVVAGRNNCIWLCNMLDLPCVARSKQYGGLGFLSSGTKSLFLHSRRWW